MRGLLRRADRSRDCRRRERFRCRRCCAHVGGRYCDRLGSRGGRGVYRFAEATSFGVFDRHAHFNRLRMPHRHRITKVMQSMTGFACHQIAFLRLELQGKNQMIRRNFLILLATGIAMAPASMSPAIAANADSTLPGFDDALKAGGPVMIHVTAPWCGECKLQKPIVARLLGEPDFRAMKKFDIDFDSQKDVLRHFRVQMQSTIIVYARGKEIDRLTGVTDPGEIEALMRKAL
ncbi:thioredoxin family protein [Labrys neptuniae]